MIRNTVDLDALEHWLKGVGWSVQYLMAQHMADVARRLCPIDTGRLRGSIAVVAGTAELHSGGLIAAFHEGDTSRAVHVVATAPYALFVEYGYYRYTTGGAVWVPPQPFMRNALAETMGAFTEIVSSEIIAPFKGKSGGFGEILEGARGSARPVVPLAGPPY